MIINDCRLILLSMTHNMQFNRMKLKAAILYACTRCEPSQLGAVKLNKVLYFSDMLHYAQAGHPLTGAVYKKRPMGPTCEQLLPTLAEMVTEGAIAIREVDYFGYRKKEYNARVEFDDSLINQEERALLDEVVEFVCRENTAKTISEFSHNKAWEMAEYGQVIPYNSVYSIFPRQVSQEAMEWASNEALRIEASRQNKDALGGKDFSDFRREMSAGIGNT